MVGRQFCLGHGEVRRQGFVEIFSVKELPEAASFSKRIDVGEERRYLRYLSSRPGFAVDGDGEFTGEGGELSIGDGLFEGGVSVPFAVQGFEKGIVDNAMFGGPKANGGAL